MKTVLNKKEQHDVLMKKVGEEVIYHYPEKRNESMIQDPKTGKFILKGKLEYRHAIEVHDYNSVVYWHIADLIRFEGETELWFRMTYYRYLQKKSKWVYAGQTSLSSPVSNFAKLFVGTIKESEGFRQLFKEICKECSKELDL